ncbi:MAG: hypothetical protein V1736_11155 [Pseudomonadota bacterium]
MEEKNGFNPGEFLPAIKPAFTTETGGPECGGRVEHGGEESSGENIGQKTAVGKKWLILSIIPLTLILS